MRPVPPPIDIPQAIQAGLEHHQAGRLAEAEQIYKQVLRADPGNLDALHLLGVIASQLGKNAIAVEWIDKALAIKPDFAEALSNRGNALQALKRYAEAVARYDQALSIKPGIAEVLSNRGNALKALGRYDEALASYDRALSIKPDYAEALFNRGNMLASQARLDEAGVSYRKLISRIPNHAEAHNNLGNTLKDQGRLDEAIASYRKAVSFKPDFAAPHYNLGLVFQSQGDLEEAVASYRAALALKPDYVEAHSNLGSALKDQGKLDQAAASCRKALALMPDYAEAHCNLGNALAALDKPDEATASYREALLFKPDFAAAHYNLGNALAALGKADEAVAGYRKALALKPDYVEAHSNLLYFLNFDPASSADEIYAAHREWDRLHAAALGNKPAPFTNSRDANRRLRIGYVSPDFRAHAVAHFASAFIGRHDKSSFEVFCYYNHTQRDEFTRGFEAAADHWHCTVGLSDEAMAQLIRAHQIDILVDLAGHTAGNRLLVFARKPAPIQMTYLGYPNTTGLAAMDYRITDWYADPAGSEAHYRERLLRLPHSLWCYQAPADMPDIVPLPALQNGYVTFGSFNNFNKIGSQCIELWAALLRRLPGSRLLMMTVPEGEVRQRLTAQFAALGVAAERLEFHGKLALNAFHRMFQRVDIALDPFPLGGGTTTCETLWMGVPVVVLVGNRFISRAGYSFLSALGRQEFAAGTPEAYIEVALDLAGDLDRLAATHAGLRAQMAASPLTDGKRFTRDLEQAYRSAWRAWCEKQ